MNVKEILSKVRTLLGEAEAKLEQVTITDGTIFEAEEVAVGAVVAIIKDDERIAVPAGEYPLEDGRVLVIDENSVIAEIKEAEAEEEEEAEDALPEEMKAILTEAKAKLEGYAKLEERIAALETQLADKEKANTNLKSQVTELSETIKGLTPGKTVHAPGADGETFEYNLSDPRQALHAGIKAIVQTN